MKKSSNVVVHFRFCLIYVCSFSRAVFISATQLPPLRPPWPWWAILANPEKVIYFIHAIAVDKATMAMVGHFQLNPKKEIQGNNQQ
jgi:hypothetical protein